MMAGCDAFAEDGGRMRARIESVHTVVVCYLLKARTLGNKLRAACVRAIPLLLAHTHVGR